MNGGTQTFIRAGAGLALGLTVCGLPFSDGAAAGDLESWHWRNPLPQGNTLNSVAWAGGIYVAVGDFGTILTSPDGAEWTPRQAPAATRLHAVRWSGEAAYAVGGAGIVLHSDDGVEWSGVSIERSPDSDIELYSLAIAAERMVAVGHDYAANAGTVVVSDDGKNWSGIAVPGLEGVILRAVAWGDGRFVAVGGDDRQGSEEPGVSLISADGLDWSVHVENSPGTFMSVVSTPEGWIAAGSRKIGMLVSNFIAFSDDGESWGETGCLEGSGRIRLFWGDDKVGFVSGSAAGVISIDGGEWEQAVQWFDESPPLNGLTWSGVTWLAVGGSGITVASVNGTIWDEVGEARRFSEHFADVVRGAGRFVAVGYDGAVAVSADGRHWSRGGIPYHDNVYYGDSLVQVVWTGQRFFAFAGNGTTFSSTDGLTWNVLGHRRVEPVRVEWIGDRMLVVAIGRLGSLGLLTTADGAHWGWANLGWRTLIDFVWTGERVIGIGQNEWGSADELFAAVMSAEGEWKVYEFGMFGWCRALGWNGNEVLAILRTGDGTWAATSTDGLQWNLQPVQADFRGASGWIPSRLHWIRERWILPVEEWSGDARGSQTVLSISEDGVEWTRKALPFSGISEIAFSDEAVVAVGRDGNLLSSHFAEPPNGFSLLLGSMPGAIRANPEMSAYEPGSIVELSAHPPSGYEFVEWVGDVSGTGSPVTLLMDSAKAVSARFRLEGATPNYHVWINALHETDAEAIGPFGDFSGDGVLNILKYAGDLPVTDTGGRQLGRIVKTDGLGLRYHVELRDDPGLAYALEYSDDLLNWTGVPVHSGQQNERIEVWTGTIGINYWTLTEVWAHAVAGGELPRFFRVRIEAAGDGEWVGDG